MKFATRSLAGFVLAFTLSASSAAVPGPKTVSIPTVLSPAQQVKVKEVRAEYRAKYQELTAKRRELQAAEARAIAEAMAPPAAPASK